VQINKTALENEFEYFLDSISYYKYNFSNSFIGSFASEISWSEFSFLLNSNLSENNDSFYWNIPDEEIEFLAVKPLIDFRINGESRLAETNLSVKEIEKSFFSNWKEKGIEDAPLVVGGIKFAHDQTGEIWQEFSDSDWFIPELLFFRKKKSVFIIYNFILANKEEDLKKYSDLINTLQKIDSQQRFPKTSRKISNFIHNNAYENWQVIIKEALDRISKGMLSKVVLSREVKIQLDNKPIFEDLLFELSVSYPKCYIFMYKRGESVFFGASPEKLAKVANGMVEVDALAGSAPRGEDGVKDVEMEHFLLTSEKNLFEQRAVVNFIHNLLSKISNKIIFDDKPIIRKLPNIQHLWTIIKAELKENVKMFDVLMTLHPTPAICGDPWKIAMYFILDMEVHDRGLYSGNIGWFNFNGYGEFTVAIRSALSKDLCLYAYAGCGIVQGSEARAEFEESEIKLKPILSLFIDEKVYQP
jgi:menaquinone-specific isochorismate synthase